MRQTIINNVQIAVVDHDRLTREFVSNVLMYCVNRKILEFENAQGIIDDLSTGRRIDLVLSEIHLPDRNGIELLQYLKKEHPRIIFVALSANPADEAAAHSFNADAFIAKPFVLKDLFEVVQRFVVEGLDIPVQ